MKIYNANKETPKNPRNNCLCDINTPCYFHIKKGKWYSKYTEEEIIPVMWSYAILPNTPTASFENMLVTLTQLGEQVFKQEFAKLSPDKQKEIFDEWQYTKKTIEQEVNNNASE